jgi:hypothetical protein
VKIVERFPVDLKSEQEYPFYRATKPLNLRMKTKLSLASIPSITGAKAKKLNY